MTIKSNPWLVRSPGAPRRLRLYCFCYAGGSAANYANWQAELSPQVEICAIELPGRGSRFGETPMSSLPLLTETVAREIARNSPMPFAFFGHSLGALLAFEVARYLQHQGLPKPLHLFASGASAPQHRSSKKKIHLLGDSEFIEELKNYNGTPPAVLAHRELMELLLPMIRADFALACDYDYRSGPLLDMPLTVMMGRDDDNAKGGDKTEDKGAASKAEGEGEPKADGEQVTGWHKETSNAFHIEWFEGDHFYIQPQRAAVLACIREALLETVAA
ncbi:MAG: thioesterase domain-containing protein [Pseudomonadota bacterium]